MSPDRFGFSVNIDKDSEIAKTALNENFPKLSERLPPKAQKLFNNTDESLRPSLKNSK